MPESLRFVILGHMSRSGSTFLTLLMDAHPEIVATPEAHFPPSMLDARARLVTLDTERTVRRYVRAAADDEKLSAWDLDWDEVADRAVAKHGLPLPAPSLFPVVLERYAASREPAARWVVYKSNGRAVQHVRRLLDTFPEVRLLWLVRDPRAAAASSMRARDPTHGLRLVGDPRGFGAVWAHQAATLARAKGDEALRPRIRLVRYEDLVRDPPSVLHGLTGWLGVEKLDPWPGAGAYAEVIPPAQRHLHDRLDPIPDPARIDAWRHEMASRDVALVEDGARPEMAIAGYEPLEPTRVSYAARLLSRAKGAVSPRLIRRASHAIRLLRSPARLGRRLRARASGW